MKAINRFILFLALLLPLLGSAQNKRVEIRTSETGVVSAWRQKVAGVNNGPEDWERISTVSGLVLRAFSPPLTKFVSRNYPAGNGVLDFAMYGTKPIVWPDGFKLTVAYRRTDVPLANQFRYADYLFHRALTSTEQADATLKPKTYWDITANVLGPLQSTPALIDASVATVVNQFASQFNPDMAGAARVVLNFETVYFPPNITQWNNPGVAIEQQGVLQFFSDAETHTWVCESASLKGQTKTLRQIFDAGKFAEECRQRTANRFVAINRFLQAKCGPNTLVCNGDGNQVYANASIAFDDHYATTKGVTEDRAYNPELWYLPANFDPVVNGSTTVTSGGLTYWQTQGFLNNYSYKNKAYVTPSDFNYITSLGTGQYRLYWPKLRMGPDRDDASIPATFQLNRAKLIAKGMPLKAIVHQWHNRIEREIVDDGGRSSELGNLGPDSRLMAPWMVEQGYIVTRMVATLPGDGFTLWTTISQGGPGVSDEHNTWSNRPLDERAALYTGQARMYKYKEYFPADRSKVKLFGPDSMYVRYTGGITGGSWAGTAEPVITDGGNGFYRRGAAMIVYHGNSSDQRSKTSVMGRVITKTAPGGVAVKWALIVATNPDLPTGTYSTFDVRFKAADLGISTDLDATGFSVTGKETMVAEVCLEPDKQTVPTLTVVGSGNSSPPTTTTTSSGTTTPSGKFFGFSFTAIPSSTWPSNNEVVVQNGRIKVIRKLNYGGAITHVSEYGGVNWVNNYDHGRQIPVTLYSGPHPFNPNPSLYVKPSPPHPFANFGYDPIETGDWTGNSSWILDYGYEASTGTHYIKSQAQNFPTTNFRTGFFYERWMRLVGDNVVRNWYKITMDRAQDAVQTRNSDGTLKRFQAENQEMPIAYLNDVLAKTVYPGASGNVIKDHRDEANTYGSTPIAKNWIGAINDNGRGLGLTGPEIWMAVGDRHGRGESGGEFGGQATYLANGYRMTLDPQGTIYMMFDVVVGTPTDFDAAAQAHSAYTLSNNKPNQSFTSNRGNWVSYRSILNDYNTGGMATVTLEYNNAEFASPPCTFNASDVSTMYIKMRNRSSKTFYLNWRRVGGSEAAIPFSVPNDGAFHTVAINVGANSDWTGLIGFFGVKAASINELATSNEYWDFQYIGYINPD